MKAIVTVNYDDYVVDFEIAKLIAETVTNGERFKQKGYGEEATYHVFTKPHKDFNIRFISDELYRMAKLAGEPKE